MKCLLEVNNLNFSYPNGVFDLKNIDLSVKPGQKLCLAGVSGSGKSTLLRVIAGLEIQHGGEVLFSGEKVLSAQEKLLAGQKGIAYLSQGFALDLFHKVSDNIKNKILHWDYKKRDKRVEELLKVTQLNHLANELPGSLSGGQKQRLAFARAVADHPQLLLLDEAFNQLDVQHKNRLMNFMFENQPKGQAIIWVSHEPKEIFRHSDKVLVLHKGKIVRKTSPQKLYEQPRTAYEAALTGTFLPYKLFKKIIYLRPENISIVDEKTRLKGTISEVRYVQGRFEALLLLNGNSIRIPVDKEIKPGSVYLKMNPYACKTNI